MQAPFISEVEKSTVHITTRTQAFRVWFNVNGGYWQTDILTDSAHGTPIGTTWLYFGCASTLIAAMANIGAAI